MTFDSAPSISIVIPTHRGRKSVTATIAALLHSAPAGVEILVVSDGASEETRSLVAAMVDPRVVLLEIEKLGGAAARNHGLQAARGEWVAFVDDDDLPRTGWFQAWLKGAASGASVVTGAVMLHKDGEVPCIRPCRLDPSDPSMSASTLLAGAFWARRDILEAVGGYDTELRAAQNQDLGLRLCDYLVGEPEATTRHVDNVVIDVMVQEARARDRRYGAARADAARIFLERYAHRLLVDREHRASLLRIIARSERLERRYPDAIRSASLAVRAEPTKLANYRSLALALLPLLTRIQRPRGDLRG